MKYQFKDGKGEHLHTLDDKPLLGTTTIINAVYPPPLAWYGSAKAVEPMGYMTAKKEPDSIKRRALLEDGLANMQALVNQDGALEVYEAFLEKCYKNHDVYKRSKGKEGTDVHAKIEAYINKCLENGGTVLADDAFVEFSDPDTRKFVQWANRDVTKFLWCEAYCFSEKLWVGGKTDFGFLHKNGRLIVGDNKPSVYPKHFIQAAGYGFQVKENGLFNADGTPYKVDLDSQEPSGYCIFDYNKGQPWYLGGDWVKKLESDFVHTVEMYNRKDLIGANTLE